MHVINHYLLRILIQYTENHVLWFIGDDDEFVSVGESYEKEFRHRLDVQGGDVAGGAEVLLHRLIKPYHSFSLAFAIIGHLKYLQYILFLTYAD